MLPNVHSQDGNEVLSDGTGCVASLPDAQLCTIPHEPNPSGAEQIDRLLREELLEVCNALKLLLEFLLRVLAHGMLIASDEVVGLHASPEEGVVEVLGGVVEDGDLGSIERGGTDDLVQGLAFVFSALNQSVELLDVGLVVLVVVEVQLLAGDERGDAIMDGEAQAGQCVLLPLMRCPEIITIIIYNYIFTKIYNTRSFRS